MSTNATATPQTVTTFEIDPQHSSAAFKVRHMMISNVKGDFGKLKGVVEYDAADPTATRIEASIETASINTGEPDRDAHLKSGDFFDVEKYPAITFHSKKIVPAGDNEYKVTGDLTIHGVTREVTLNVETTAEVVKDPWGGLRMGASATAKIRRKDFGLNWNAALEAGGVLVGDEVAITLEVELKKKAA